MKSDKLRVFYSFALFGKEDYFSLFFKQHRQQSIMQLKTNSPVFSEHPVENALDGKYETVWMPKEWGNQPASLTLDLGETRPINKIIWASSRTSPGITGLPRITL